MKMKKIVQITLYAAAAIVSIAAILVTTGNQIIYLFWLLIPLIWLLLSKESTEFGITKVNLLKAVVLGLAFGIGVGLLKYYFSSTFPLLTSGFLKYTTDYLPKVGILVYILMIFVGDMVRELFYRGYLQTRFIRRFSPFIAILFAAVLLGLTDQIEGVYSMASVTINGIISGYLFYSTKNLISSIVFIPTQFIVILLLSL